MSKFSQGTWYVDTAGIVHCDYEYDRKIAWVFTSDTTQEIDNANARLIVAAPKMYERLKLLARLISRQAQGQLRDSIDPAIADSIYELLAKIDNEPVATMKYSSSFFQNRNCEYFPCHEGIETDKFSCLFCFCPLYHMEKCPGNPKIRSNGIKDCFSCTLPHTDYNAIIATLKEVNS